MLLYTACSGDSFQHFHTAGRTMYSVPEFHTSTGPVPLLWARWARAVEVYYLTMATPTLKLQPYKVKFQ